MKCKEKKRAGYKRSRPVCTLDSEEEFKEWVRKKEQHDKVKYVYHDSWETKSGTTTRYKCCCKGDPSFHRPTVPSGLSQQGRFLDMGSYLLASSQHQHDQGRPGGAKRDCKYSFLARRSASGKIVVTVTDGPKPSAGSIASGSTGDQDSHPGKGQLRIGNETCVEGRNSQLAVVPGFGWDLGSWKGREGGTRQEFAMRLRQPGMESSSKVLDDFHSVLERVDFLSVPERAAVLDKMNMCIMHKAQQRQGGFLQRDRVQPPDNAAMGWSELSIGKRARYGLLANDQQSEEVQTEHQGLLHAQAQKLVGCQLGHNMAMLLGSDAEDNGRKQH